MNTLPPQIIPRVLGVVACALLAGCATTGDPMEGGLFRWSEAKAQGRIADRRSELASDRRQRAHETQSSAALRNRVAHNRQEIGARTEANRAAEDAADRAARNARTAHEQQALAGVLEKAEALERDSPSAAIASRARRLRTQIERTARAPELTRSQKESRIRAMDGELDRSRAEAGL